MSALSLDVPESRLAALAGLIRELGAARAVALTTHVNADGDGAGSEAAVALWLRARGKRVVIANPTPFPALFRYLLPDDSGVAVPAPGPELNVTVADVDLFFVLDTSEPKRIGRVAGQIGERPVLLLDHHPSHENTIPARVALQDPSACATGELVYDLLVTAGTAAFPPGVPEALYAAIVTDTGSFRFANTTPRTHALAADLLARGVDPEAAYRHLYGSVPLKRVHLLRAALDRLTVDDAFKIAWITIPYAVMEACGTTSEDLEGIIEHARTIEGAEVAVLLREMADGGVKVSLRSTGGVDVNAVARGLGGGGHTKAAGALISGPLEEAERRVLVAVRQAVGTLERGPGPR